MKQKESVSSVETDEIEKKADKQENVSGEMEKKQEPENMSEGKDTFIYIGPALTGLKTNSVYTGTKTEVYEYLKEFIVEIPQVKSLIVEVSSLTKAKKQVRVAGTVLNKYYNDILSLSKGGI